MDLLLNTECVRNFSGLARSRGDVGRVDGRFGSGGRVSEGTAADSFEPGMEAGLAGKGGTSWVVSIAESRREGIPVAFEADDSPTLFPKVSAGILRDGLLSNPVGLGGACANWR